MPAPNRTVAVVAGASALIVTLLSGSPQAAQPAAAVASCWDFATLSPATVYRIDDEFRVPTATIQMKNYLWFGNKITSPSAQVYVTPTEISGGPAPEFRLYVINAHVEPDAPVTLVSFNFGHFASPGGAHANIGVNGELVEVTQSLLDLNGRVLGVRPSARRGST